MSETRDADGVRLDDLYRLTPGQLRRLVRRADRETRLRAAEMVARSLLPPPGPGPTAVPVPFEVMGGPHPLGGRPVAVPEAWVEAGLEQGMDYHEALLAATVAAARRDLGQTGYALNDPHHAVRLTGPAGPEVTACDQQQPTE